MDNTQTETVSEGYLWARPLWGIDNRDLLDECLFIESVLRATIVDPREDGNYGSFSSSNFREYNTFTFPSRQLYCLYDQIRHWVRDYIDPYETYALQSWINVFRQGGHITWHDHYKAGQGVLHGYYCVNVGDTKTEYQIPDRPECSVQNRDGLLVWGLSEGDQHRSEPWWGEEPRVTIAFDVIPTKIISYERYNHFLPFHSGLPR
jgi:hypothetical protein